jgi:hypothetical protein|tara:strand:- start:495 stop:2345 length:1851 start_codon:yes stop_codon:yes gene_type:complete
MPLSSIIINQGVVKDIPEYTAAKVGPYWVDSDKIRFVNGLPQKIGGWEKITTSPTTLTSSTAVDPGICRILVNWRTLAGVDYLAVGSEKQLLLLQGETLYDITPLRKTTTALSGSTPIATTSGSATVTVTDASHGATVGEIVSFSGAAEVNNITLSGIYELVSVPSSNTYTLVATTTADASGTGGGSSVKAEYLIGYDEGMLVKTSTLQYGWGTGTWGASTWGTERAASGVNQAISQWSFELWGEDLIATLHNFKTYVWDASNGTNTRAQVLTASEITNSRFTTVSFPDRHVIAHGAYNTSSSYQDPMLVRWSDQESNSSWTPSASNTAGSQRLQLGTKVMDAVSTREETFIGTDEAVYGMQFVGPPFTFSFRLLGTNCGPISQNSMITESDIVYWMGRTNFFIFDGQVKELPCSVQNYIFDDLNLQQYQKIFSGVNRKFKEIIWFYVSDSIAGDEPARYVTYNLEGGSWAVGTMERTAWHDAYGIQILPYSADANYLYNQEKGVNADGSALAAHIESSPLEFDAPQAPDGTKLFMLDKIIPDGTFTGNLYMTIKTKKYPNSTEIEKGPFTITSSTTKVSTRAKGRQMKVKIYNSGADEDWELGTFRVNLREDSLR